MRFSIAIARRQAAAHADGGAAREPAAEAMLAPPAAAAITRPALPAKPQALPDDLDARVRLIGEWQLGEA